MKKLTTLFSTMAIMAMIATPAFAAPLDAAMINGGDAGATSQVVTVDATQTDTYRATVAWGGMAFSYDFGTWDAATHTWAVPDGDGWTAAEFNGTNDMVTITNHSSQPISADFTYVAATASDNTTVGIFTDASGNANGTDITDMELPLCPVGAAVDAAPTDATYLNLTGKPSNKVGTAGAITGGTITVNLTNSL